MFLKRITISGFKSFADRVDFEIGKGVTCIVGPNGCGKSNVVDAAKWVLGEQSARSLRGRQMADMIFNGSSSRRSSSVSQVELVFDNSDHMLPSDHEEIVVTRKLYRSGESEYLLNNASARLKDIRELFLDTGVGVDAYTVIEQGRVDGLLQSSPTERRAIFEEAAGISRYKARRREAERKLERTDQNLLRVDDIVEEIEKRLRSVKLQAAKARNYVAYDERLRELRSRYAMAEYHRYCQETKALSDKVRESSDRATSLRTDIDRREAEGSQTAVRLDALAEEINTTDNDLVQSRADLAACDERIASAQLRADEQTGLMERAAVRVEADQQRSEEARRDLDEAQRNEVSIKDRSEKLADRIREFSERDQKLARALTEARAVLEDEKAGIIDLLRQSAETHNEIIRLNTHRESLVSQQGRLASRDAQITAELEHHLTQKADLEGRLREVESLIAEETRRLEEKKAEAVRANTVRRELTEQLAAAKERRSGVDSRRELLEDLERNMEGVGAGVRRILDTKKTAGPEQDFGWLEGVVADVLETDVVNAGVIQAALGDSDQHLVVSDTASFKRFVEHFGQLPGRVVALCLDRLPPLINDRDFSDAPGYVARAIDLVRYPISLELLARHLLGKTVVVEDLDAALELARNDVAGHRFVTRNAEIVDPSGLVSVGSGSTDSGWLSRRTQLKDLREQQSVLEETIAAQSEQLNRIVAEVEHLEAVQQELRTAVYESSTAKVEAEAALQSIGDAVARLTFEKPLVAQEAALIEEEIESSRSRSEANDRSLRTLQDQNSQRERQVENHQERIDQTLAQRQEAQDELTSARVEAGQLAEKQSATAEIIRALRRTLGELDVSISGAKNDIQRCQAVVAEASASVAASRMEVERLQSAMSDLSRKANELRGQREKLRVEVEQIHHAVKATRSQLEETERRIHEFETSLAEARVRRDDLVTRVREELMIDLAGTYEPSAVEEQDWQEVEEEITELRTKMDRLGHVNLDAINELDELQERHSFLTTQRDDLTDSKKQLEQLIRQLNDESEQRFRTAFDQIREHFRTMFRRLFGGGRADVLLEDPENILDCGIEIVAQPPGKDLQVISLMSGGEKSMTAIALLMSIFKSKPAPFVILDEVDAALDEANNERFNRIAQEFVKDVQFIIITHSKWTMSIADQLYGITMQEPGVSTRVSVQLTSASSVA